MCPIDRSGCSAARHGTASAYNYGCRCPDARQADYLYRKRGRHGTRLPAIVPATSAQRRIRALQRLGWLLRELSTRLGRSPYSRGVSTILTRTMISRIVAARVAEIYEELSMTPGPSTIAQNRAIAKHWAAPLDWDDIDNDPEPPATSENADTKLDEVAIARAASGHMAMGQLRIEERRTAVARLRQSGHSTHDIADRLNVDWKTIQRDRNMLDNRRNTRGAAS